MRHLSSCCHPFLFLNSRTITLLPRLLFSLPQPVHTLTLRLQVSVLDVQSGLRTSLFFLPVCLRDRGGKGTRWERWGLALSMASVSPLIYCSLYTGSMRTNQPLPVVTDDRKKKRLFSSSGMGVLSSSPSIFDAFGRDLFHVLRLKLDDLRYRCLYFDLTLFPYFSHFRRYEITGKD